MIRRLPPLPALALLLLPASLAHADDPPAPEGQVVLFKLRAEGVQIYECRPTNAAPGQERLQWVLKGPDAVLTGDKGEKAGRHYAGPAWESTDGSKVVADKTPVEKTPKPPAVPWLLLKAASHEGDGAFSKVTYIRRVETEGGAAPDAPDPAYRGDELRVPYKATYIFYGPK